MLNAMGAKHYETQLNVIKFFMVRGNFFLQIVFN